MGPRAFSRGNAREVGKEAPYGVERRRGCGKTSKLISISHFSIGKGQARRNDECRMPNAECRIEAIADCRMPNAD